MRRRAVPLLTIAILVLAAIPASRALRPWWRARAIRSAAASPDVLLITIDTTRADKLGCYGGDPGTSPVLDRLAKGGVLCRRAYSHVPLTLPSHASILTGLTPAHHGVHDNGNFVLQPGYATLGETFTKAGYRTAAFVSSVVLDRKFGLDRGFDRYEDSLETDESEEILAQVRAEVTVGRALGWIRSADSRPFFAWVHLYDPHTPYDPPEPFASRFRGKRYDGEIAYMDSQIGVLLQGVEERKRPTLVAVIADHGESLGEHQEPTHAFFIYGATQHVPLILSFPGVLPPGVEVEPLVRSVDLAPTLLEIARLPAAASLDGRSLVPLITGASDREPGPAYQESFTPRLWWGYREVLGVRTGRWLYVRAPRPELYDVEEDPAETANLASERPEELERLGAVLDRLTPEGDPLSGRTSVDPETARRLRALGYLGGLGSDLAARTDLPDAKDVAPVLKGITEAEAYLDRREFEKALAGFQGVLERMPDSPVIASRIAKTLLALDRFDAAFEQYRKLRDKQPEDEGFHIGMARARFRQGRKEEALALVRESLKAFPESVALNENAGIILQDLGRLPEAEGAYRAALELGPRELRPRIGLATVFDKQGRLEEAAVQYEAVVDRSPHSKEGRRSARRLATLGETLARDGKLQAARDAYERALRSADLKADVYLNLAFVCYRLGQQEEALAVLQQGVAKLPDSVDLRYREARLLGERGRSSEAEAQYLKILELAPARSDARFQLARLLESSGRLAEATLAYQHLLDHDPGSREAAGARQALQRLGTRSAGR